MDRFAVPEELRQLLLDFTINCLIESPKDYVDFAITFFTNLRDGKGSAPGANSEDDGEGASEDDIEPPVAVRRKSVFSEAYNPEEDEDDAEKVVYPKSDEQRKRLAEAVKQILLFRSLDPEQMQEVIDAMFEKKVKKAEFIITQGDDGDNFYVIESGVYSIYVNMDGKNKQVGKYENKGSFGELALMYNMPRAATIQADTPGLIWGMDRQTFRRIVLKSAFKKRQMYEKLIENVPLLNTLQPYERMNVADALQTRTFPAKTRIIKQGDAADGMYFIEKGTVRITVATTDGKEETEVSTVEKGGYFGELALVTHKKRAANVYAVDNVKLAFLDVEAFERLLGPCMSIMKRNIGNYEEQLEKTFGKNWKSNITEMR